MVEMLANESESHAALAGVRQHQGRWEDAQHHWRQVIRIRSQEPTGYLNLARIQIRQKEWGAARETCRTIIGRKWPDRFGDARREAEQLLRKIPAEAETTAP
jgi:tetratricopeptide (TPR) repeat protein